MDIETDTRLTELETEILELKKRSDSFSKLSGKADEAKRDLENILLKETLAVSNERYGKLQTEVRETLNNLVKVVNQLEGSNSTVKTTIEGTGKTLILEGKNAISQYTAEVSQTLEPIRRFQAELKFSRWKIIGITAGTTFLTVTILARVAWWQGWKVLLWILGVPVS